MNLANIDPEFKKIAENKLHDHTRLARLHLCQIETWANVLERIEESHRANLARQVLTESSLKFRDRIKTYEGL